MRDRIRLKSKMNIMDDMDRLASVDTSKAGEMKKMKIETESTMRDHRDA